MFLQHSHKREEIEHSSLHYLVDRMPVPSFRLAVRVASLGKLLSTISTLPGLIRAGPFQSTSVCAISGKVITALCFVPNLFEPGTFHLEG